MTLSSSVAWGQQGARPWGLLNLKVVRRSRSSHLVDRPFHPLCLHTLRGTSHMASSSCRRRRRRNSLIFRRGLWQTSISTIKLWTHWVLVQTYIICSSTLDRCNSPTGCQVYHSDWREFSECFPMSTLGSYLVSKRELRRKLTCRKACWMDFGI
jgi:hypothetical protein